MTNHLGHVYGVFDQTGTRVESLAYSPYGAISGDDLSVQPFGMSTKRSDFASGLVYFGYRFYVPHLGRWLNRDPLQEQGGINLYGYVYGDPLGYVDPDGRRVMVAPLLPPTGYSGNNGNLSSRGNGGMVRPPYGSSNRYESSSFDGNRLGRFIKDPEARLEHDYYKSVCKPKLPPSGDQCQDYRNQSQQAQMCANLRQQWDDKWWPGRHTVEIMKELRRARKYNRLAEDCERQKEAMCK